MKHYEDNFGNVIHSNIDIHNTKIFIYNHDYSKVIEINNIESYYLFFTDLFISKNLIYDKANKKLYDYNLNVYENNVDYFINNPQTNYILINYIIYDDKLNKIKTYFDCFKNIRFKIFGLYEEDNIFIAVDDNDLYHLYNLNKL